MRRFLLAIWHWLLPPAPHKLPGTDKDNPWEEPLPPSRDYPNIHTPLY